jgi:hypothetical protein
MSTRRQVCELIIRRLAGGDPPAEFPIKVDEVNLWLNHGIFASSVKSYQDAVQYDGVEFVPDAYYTTFRNLALTQDADTGYWKATLPSTPGALPRGYDISTATIMLQGRLSASMMRVSPQQIDSLYSLPRPNGIFFWVEGNVLHIESRSDLTGKSAMVRMVSSEGTGSLDEEIKAPADAMDFIITYVYNKFAPLLNVPVDNNNDGQNIK